VNSHSEWENCFQFVLRVEVKDLFQYSITSFSLFMFYAQMHERVWQSSESWCSWGLLFLIALYRRFEESRGVNILSDTSIKNVCLATETVDSEVDLFTQYYL